MSQMGEEAEPGSQSGGGNARCALSSENYSMWTMGLPGWSWVPRLPNLKSISSGTTEANEN